jgi:hypothetical protein
MATNEKVPRWQPMPSETAVELDSAFPPNWPNAHQGWDNARLIAWRGTIKTERDAGRDIGGKYQMHVCQSDTVPVERVRAHDNWTDANGSDWTGNKRLGGFKDNR